MHINYLIEVLTRPVNKSGKKSCDIQAHGELTRDALSLNIGSVVMLSEKKKRSCPFWSAKRRGKKAKKGFHPLDQSYANQNQSRLGHSRSGRLHVFMLSSHWFLVYIPFCDWSFWLLGFLFLRLLIEKRSKQLLVCGSCEFMNFNSTLLKFKFWGYSLGGFEVIQILRRAAPRYPSPPPNDRVNVRLNECLQHNSTLKALRHLVI